MNVRANPLTAVAPLWFVLALLGGSPCLAADASGESATPGTVAGESAPGESAEDVASDDLPDEADAGPGAPPQDSPVVPDERVDRHLMLAELAMQQMDLPAAAREFTLAAEAGTDPALAERATQFTFAAGLDGYAMRSASRWAELAPDSPVPREIMGRLLIRRHDIDRAAEELGKALGYAKPQRDEVYLALAADLALEDDARSVTRTLSRLAARDPLSPGLQLALGTAALRSGDDDLALAAAEAASVGDPEWLEPRLLTARALAATGQGDAAIARLDALVADHPGPGIELEYVRILADLGRTDAARERFARLVKSNGDSLDVQRTAALLSLAAGEFEAATEGFTRLSVSNATRFESFYYLGQIAARQDNPEDARRWFGRVSAGPYLVPAQIASAETLWRAGQIDAALAGLELFARDHPAQSYDILEVKAQILQLAKRPDDALAVYGQALVYKPDSVRLLLARGALLDQAGRIADALADLKKAATIAPEDAAAINAYGYTLANRTRHTGQAYDLVRRALEIEPDSPAIQDSMGWILQQQGRRVEARSWLEEAYGRLPDPELASHLAEVWWSLGEKDRARTLLQETLAKHPDSEPVAETARRLLK